MAGGFLGGRLSAGARNVPVRVSAAPRTGSGRVPKKFDQALELEREGKAIIVYFGRNSPLPKGFRHH